jgi:hypothetical protein
VLFAEPLDRALEQAWSVRVQRGSSARWRGFVDRWVARRELPPAIDIPRLAGVWADRVGRDAVHVVAAPRSFPEAASTTADLLDLVLRSRRELRPRWPDLEPGAVDLLRRLNGVLGVRTTREERAAAAHAFVRIYDEAEPAGHHLTVPERHLAWAREAAERMADDLAAGGYPVHGRLEELVPDTGGRSSRPRRRDVLRVVIWACLQQTSVLHDGAEYEAGAGKVAT